MITNLRQNITGLEKILTAVNELPEAGSNDGSVETCTVTISVSNVSSPAKYFSSSHVAITYVNAEGETILANDITLTGSMLGTTHSRAFTITVQCRCNTPLTVMWSIASAITSISVSEEITQVLHPTEVVGYGLTVVTPDKTGNYTITLTT